MENPNIENLNKVKADVEYDVDTYGVDTRKTLNSFGGMFSGDFKFPSDKDEAPMIEDKDVDASISNSSKDISEEIDISNTPIPVGSDGNIMLVLKNIQEKLNKVYTNLDASQKQISHAPANPQLKHAVFTPQQLPIDFEFDYKFFYKTSLLWMFFIPYRSFKFSIKDTTIVTLNCEDVLPDSEAVLVGSAMDLPELQLSMLVFLIKPDEDELNS